MSTLRFFAGGGCRGFGAAAGAAELAVELGADADAGAGAAGGVSTLGRFLLWLASSFSCRLTRLTSSVAMPAETSN